MVVLAVQLLLAETFRGLHDIRLASIFFNLVNGALLAIFLGVLWLLKGQASLPVVILLAAGSNFVAVLLAAGLLYRKVASFPSGHATSDIVGFGGLVRVGLPLLVVNMSLLILAQGYVDMWILSAFRSEEEVAVFGAAARIGFLVAMPMQVVNSVVSPLIAQMYAQGRQQELQPTLRAVATLASVPAFAALVGFVLLGGAILGLVFGDFYRVGAMALVLLSIAQFINVWVGPAGTTLVMAGHQTVAMVITIAGGLVMIAGGLWLAGPYGVTGVAVATAAGIIVTNLSYWLVARRRTGMWTHAGFRGFSFLARIAKRAT
jgi:O-antigen/teichoic acid export membrane protein